MLSLEVIGLLVAALYSTANAAAVNSTAPLLKRNVPNKINECATPGDKKYQPAMDFDTDGCYNVPAIDGDGYLNPGIDTCESKAAEGGCRDEGDLKNNNVYSRARRNSGWCAFMYGYYFEKDQMSHCKGHRHDWEHVVVWEHNGEPKYVGASAHGGYDIQPWDGVLKDGTHPKIVYHKDSLYTHAMRFATDGDDKNVENHYHKWFYGDLISYFGFPSGEIRDKMLGNNWGDATPDFKDARFKDALEIIKYHDDIVDPVVEMDFGRDDPGSPGQPTCG